MRAGVSGGRNMAPVLLSSDNPENCRELAAHLDRYNKERKEIEAEVQAEALLKVEQSSLKDDPVIVCRGGGVASGRHRHRREPPEGRLSAPRRGDRP